MAPKKKTGFGNVTSMNNQPSPPPRVQKRDRRPTQPTRNDRPGVPPQRPEPNQGALSTGPSNSGGPTKAPYPFSGPRALQDTGIFRGTGVSEAEMQKIFEDDSNTPDTPTKTNQKTISELQNMLETAVNDEDLLQLFQRRLSDVRGGKTIEERKDELRRAVESWIEAGLTYTGPRRPGLYLDDGTRNPARPPRGAAGGPPPPQTPPSGTGNGPEGTTPDTPSSAYKKFLAEPGTSSTTTTPAGSWEEYYNRTGTSPPTPTKAPPTAGTGKRSSSNTTIPPRGGRGTRPSTGTGKGSPSGISKGPSSNRGKNSSSPLRRPPITMATIDSTIADTTTGTGASEAGPPQGPPEQTTSGTGGAGWQRRDDLFEPQVMDAAGITWFPAKEEASALPTLASKIDYNVENWK